MVKNKTYCWSCDKQVEMIKEKEEIRANRAVMLKGNCIDCDTKIIKFLKVKKRLG
jgi:hypothetical protein